MTVPAIQTLDFTLLPETFCELGESPVWDAATNALLWADIPRGIIHERRFEMFAPGEAVRLPGSHRSWTLNGTVGSLGLCRSGRLVVALNREVGLFDRASGQYQRLAVLEPDSAPTKLNDGKVGPDGAFWVGSMERARRMRTIGALYRVTADGRVEKRVDGLIVSNGLAWTGDGRTMFHSDSRGQWIDRWRFDPATGAMDERTRIATPGPEVGRPDGAATDAEGCYWSAGISAGVLNRYAADGTLRAKIAAPTAAPTMPCFAGPDFRTLFVTSLVPEDRPATRWCGAVFTARAPVAGIGPFLFDA